MVDLNELVSPSSNLNLTEADYITDEGLIVARGFTSTGDTQTAILIPEGEATDFTPADISSSSAASVSPSVRRTLTEEGQRHMRKIEHFRPGVFSAAPERLAAMYTR
jgi:hypothetical protein